MDKQDTKKAFKQFETQIQQIIDVIYHKVDEFEVHEAMIAKKPLGTLQCLSC